MEPETNVASMSLEDTEITPPPAAPATDHPPPAEVAADAEPEPEGTIEIPQGKVVPLAAVQSERAKRKEAEKAKGALEAKLAEVSQKAQAFDEAKQYLDQARPIIEQIRAQKNQPPPTPAVDPALEQEATEYAKDFDLFTAEGKPDVARAIRIIQRNDARAARQAQQAVSPILQTEAQRQSTALYQHYVNQPETNGFKIDAAILSRVWNQVPPDIAVQPGVAEVLYNTALGLQLRSGHKPTTATPPPVITESLGGNKPAETTLDTRSEKFLSASGMKAATFKETREKYRPGQNNSLE